MELAHLVYAGRVVSLVSAGRVVTRPLARFVLLGALLFACVRTFAPGADGAPAQPQTFLSSPEIDALRSALVAERARAPEPGELAEEIRARLDDEVLAREALALGLDEGDPVVQRRLRENGRFLAVGDADPEVQREEADALGMRLRDPVIQRRLANVMRLRLAEAARGGEPTREELEAELARERDTLRASPRIALSQRYLGPARALPLPASLPLQTEAMLARSFGPGFARDVFALPPGSWSGPIRSIHGLHRVRVERREAGGVPPLEAVAARLRDTILAARDARAVEAALPALRARHLAQIAAGTVR